MKTLAINSYLSETNLLDSIDFTKPFRVSLDSPTGSGKSTYIINYLKEKQIPFIFLCDTLLLAKQLAKAHNLPYYAADRKETVKEKQIITIYNHINKVYNEEAVLIIDEAHSLVSNNNFRSRDIEKVLNFGTLSEKVLLLSGTPLFTKDEFYNNLETIQVRRSSETAQELNIIETNDIILQAIEMALISKQNGKIPVFSLLNTTDSLLELQGQLMKAGFSNIGVINSKVKNGEMDVDSTHYEELVNTGNLNVDALITTYDQGYSIYNTNCDLIFLPGSTRHSYASIVQMIARFRKIEKLNIYLVKTASEPLEESIDLVNMKNCFNLQTLNQYIYHRYEEKATGLLERLKRNKKFNRAAKAFLSLIEKDSDLVNESLEINHQAVGFRTLIKLTNLMYADINFANKILNYYNITVKIMNKTEFNIKLEKSKLTNDRTQEIVEELFSSIGEDGKLSEKVEPVIYKAYNFFTELNRFETNISKCKSLMLEAYGDTKKWNHLIEGYSLRKSQDIQVKSIRQSIYSKIKQGNWYSKDELFKIIAPIVKEYKGDISKVKCGILVDHYFEVEESGKRVDGKVVHGYLIQRVK
jgi:hypothetical protein